MAKCAIDQCIERVDTSVSGSYTVQEADKHDRTLIPALPGFTSFSFLHTTRFWQVSVNIHIT